MKPLLAVIWLLGCVLSMASLAEQRVAPVTVVPAYNASHYHDHPECAVAPRNTSLGIQSVFSTDNAYLLMLTSALTEARPSQVYDQLHEWGFDSPTVWTHFWFGLRMIVAEHEEFTLVAFRGTTVVADYVSNAMYGQRSTEKLFTGNAHRGFWGVFERTHERLHELVARAGGKDKPVVFTGHSRGGAFATLMATYWHDQGGEVAALYTFAQPRLGDDELAGYIQERLGDRYYRIDVDRDITPQVPPTWDVAGRLQQAGYLHPQLAGYVEQLNYGYDAGSLFVLPETGGLFPVVDQTERADEFWFGFYERLLGGKPLDRIPQIIQDFPAQHKTDLYICRLLESM